MVYFTVYYLLFSEARENCENYTIYVICKFYVNMYILYFICCADIRYCKTQFVVELKLFYITSQILFRNIWYWVVNLFMNLSLASVAEVVELFLNV